MRVLVVTVGLSPIPVALSILTLEPTHVVYVVSEESRHEYERIHAVVHRHLGESLTEIVFEITDAATQDFVTLAAELGTRADSGPRGKGTLWATLEGLQRDGRSAFILDYTGGTKVMVASLVEFHVAWHGGDRPALRSYVPGGRQALHFGGRDASNIRLLQLFGDLTLAERAELNGYRISTGWAWNPEAQVPSSSDVAAWPPIRQAGPTATEAEAENAWAESVRDFIKGFTLIGIENPTINGGTQAECAFAALALANPPDELIVGARYSPLTTGAQVAEFDFVWRKGARVVVGEVKRQSADRDDATRLSAQLAAFCTRVLLSREVFGDTVGNVWWLAGDPESQKLLGPLATRFDTHLGHGGITVLPGAGTGGKVHADKLGTAKNAMYTVLTKTEGNGGRSDPQAKWEAVASVAVNDLKAELALKNAGFLDSGNGQVTALSGVGGTVLAAEVSTFIAEVKVDLFASTEQRTRYGAYLRLPRVGYQGSMADELEVAKHLRDQLDRKPDLGGYVVTAGPKSVTAAMAALATDRGLDLGNVNLAKDTGDDVVVTRSGRSLSLSAGNVNWAEFMKLQGLSIARPQHAPQGWQLLLPEPDTDFWADSWQLVKLLDDDHAGASEPVREALKQLFPQALQRRDRRVRLAFKIASHEINTSSAAHAYIARLSVASRLFGEAADIIFVLPRTPRSRVSRHAQAFPFTSLRTSARDRISFIARDGPLEDPWQA